MSENRYAILIASSRFPKADNLQALAGPENDVAQVQEILTSSAHGNFGKVTTLKNRPHHQILRKINEILYGAERDDMILLYYSGHGKLDTAGQLHLATVNTEMAALETTSIPLITIQRLIANSAATKTALILDCCYSGAVDKAFFRGDVEEQLNLMSGGRGTFIMTASTGLQMAKEREDEKLGIFTKHLVEGVRSGKADRDGDGLITMNELYNYVHEQVKSESAQEPMKWDLDVRGELIFAKSGKSPASERRADLRRRILELASSYVLPDGITRRSLDVISKKPSELVGSYIRYDALLDHILVEDFRAGPFVEAWYAIERETVKAAPEAAQAPAADRRARPEDRRATPEDRRATPEDRRAPPKSVAEDRPAPAKPVAEERPAVEPGVSAGRFSSSDKREVLIAAGWLIGWFVFYFILQRLFWYW